ncbi:MAG: D-alanyl-lipoteichoic acid biosynthesis protein DltB [Firmicutes bacterium]|nr:D-alanyl-lipoteichoic acid biosynthesis protein DltB [Bacillota bacterium]
MTPYATISYFGFLLYPTLPAVALGLVGRLSRWFVLGVTLLMIGLQYGLLLPGDAAVNVGQCWQLLAYAAYEGALVKGFSLLRARDRAMPRWAPAVTVTLVLLPLAAAKLLPALHVSGLVGFLGISYLTFRSLDVIFGIQDRLIKQIRLRDFWLFLLFFPTIASGPVDRYRRFMKDWEQKRSRAEYLQDLDAAVHRIFRGLLYKFIIAYYIETYWLSAAGATHTALGGISYMYAYSFYLFFDFAGYSCFAVGVSYLFGVRTPENFDNPFLAQNIRDFWNRWHISLSWWFRDHVYMRFVMWATKRKLLANKYAISYLGFILSMGLMGIWHGLQWHYILYGLYHAALIIGFDYLSRWNKRHKRWGEGPVWRWAGVFITFQVVCFGLLLFSGRLFQ